MKKRIVFLVVIIVLGLIGAYSSCCKMLNDEVKRQGKESPATTVLRTVGNGKPIGLTDFENVFPSGVNMLDARAWETAEDLGILKKNLAPMLDKKNYEVRYIGPPEGVPVKLRTPPQPSTQPATAPTTRRTEHLIIEYQPPATTESAEFSGGHSPK